MAEWVGASWDEIGKVVVSTLAIYVTVVIGLRLAGRRTVSQMSAFDVVVTIALGSLIASTALSPEPSYARTAAAFATLLTAQQVAAVLRRKIPATRRLLDFSPEVLYRDGEVRLRQSPLTAQVSKAELLSRIRQAGAESFDEIKVVILEPTGEISVLRGAASEIWTQASS